MSKLDIIPLPILLKKNGVRFQEVDYNYERYLKCIEPDDGDLKLQNSFTIENAKVNTTEKTISFNLPRHCDIIEINSISAPGLVIKNTEVKLNGSYTYILQPINNRIIQILASCTRVDFIVHFNQCTEEIPKLQLDCTMFFLSQKARRLIHDVYYGPTAILDGHFIYCGGIMHAVENFPIPTK